jgi:hypothetical protein
MICWIPAYAGMTRPAYAGTTYQDYFFSTNLPGFHPIMRYHA